MFYLTMYSTHFILLLYGVRHSEKGNLLQPWATILD